MLARLRGRSLHEPRVRGLEAAHAFAERAGLGTTIPPGASATPALHAPDDASWSAAIAARWPDHVRDVVARADDAARGRFHLLGLAPLDAGLPPDWQRDPDSGLRAPDGHWSRVPYLDETIVGDHKVTWELSRQQYLVTLAQAWRLTRDPRHAEAAATLLGSWIDGNPPTRGMNWASALEVAFRAIAWLWTLHLLRDAPAPDAALRARAVGVLALHGRHLERYLSTYFSPNTHLTGEALGLLHLGVALPGLPRAARWRAQGTAVLQDEATRQIRADGTYFEQTTWYQHYTVEFYLHALRLWEGAGVAVPSIVHDRAQRAAEVLHAVLRPDGTLPLLGDDDGGRTLPLDGRRPGDFRDTLAVAAVRFGRADFARRVGALPAAAAWVLGPDGTARYDALLARDEPPAREALRVFPDGGLCVLRDERAPGTLLVLDAGRHGELTSGHSHADALAFDLTVDGRPTLVDPGTHRYVGPTRDAFRHAAAHNTLTLDGRSASEPAGKFRWAHVAHARVVASGESPLGAAVQGEVEGWAFRAALARHRRTVLRPGDPRDGWWLVLDEVDAGAPADVALHFRGGPGLAAAAEGAERWALRDAAGTPVLRVAHAAPVAGALTIDAGRASRAYGHAEPAPAVTWRARGDGRLAVGTLLATSDAQIDATIDADAACWRVRTGDAIDHVSLGAPRTVGDLALDGAVVWLRERGGAAVGFLVLAPTDCRLAGRPIADGAPRWLAGTRTNDGWALTSGA